MAHNLLCDYAKINGTNMCVSLHSKNDPSDEEWYEHLYNVSVLEGPINIIVLTDGGKPNPIQRQKLFNLIEQKKKNGKNGHEKTAVVSLDATTVIFIKVFGWFRPEHNLKSFHPKEDFLGYLYERVSIDVKMKFVEQMIKLGSKMGGRHEINKMKVPEIVHRVFFYMM